jgi:hypothetical protein
MVFDAKARAEQLRPEIMKIWPDIERGDFERAAELMGETPDYRREDLLLALDQAYSERNGTPHRLNPNWFTVTGMLKG